MCDCVTKFQFHPPSLTLPLDPKSTFCNAPEPLSTEYKALCELWTVYVQHCLLAVIQHQRGPVRFGSTTPPLDPTRATYLIAESKKKRRRPMSPLTRRRALDLLSAGRNVSEIAEQLKVPPRSVSDLKYAIGKRSTAQEVASGQ